ncbi:hypothetical protein EHI44_33215 [Rhizobium leguminosarum]|nr:hypothetical protein EHI44_33215 [Rhizobium leguminosarum]
MSEFAEMFRRKKRERDSNRLE